MFCSCLLVKIWGLDMVVITPHISEPHSRHPAEQIWHFCQKSQVLVVLNRTFEFQSGLKILKTCLSFIDLGFMPFSVPREMKTMLPNYSHFSTSLTMVPFTVVCCWASSLIPGCGIDELYWLSFLSSGPTSEALLLHCSSWLPYFWPHPRLVLHYSPISRGLQEEISDYWWAAIWRGHCIAAKSLWWCSVVLFDSSARYWWQY